MKYIDTPRGRFGYEPVYLYVGRKVIDRETAFENLKELAPLLDRSGIRFGPVFGTLLGIVRDNDFIEWDEDIDLYVLKEDEQKLLDAFWTLREHGFELVRYDKRGLYSVMRNDEYIDFYIFRKISSEVRTSGGPGFILERFLQDTIDYDFKGVSLRIPRDYDGFLTFQYGDWRTPVKFTDYQVSPWRIFLGKVRCWLKNLIPQSVYPFFIRMYRKKDLRKFREKCSRYGVELHEPLKM